jgi:hypothetical protein
VRSLATLLSLYDNSILINSRRALIVLPGRLLEQLSNLVDPHIKLSSGMQITSPNAHFERVIAFEHVSDRTRGWVLSGVVPIWQTAGAGVVQTPARRRDKRHPRVL